MCIYKVKLVSNMKQLFIGIFLVFITSVCIVSCLPFRKTIETKKKNEVVNMSKESLSVELEFDDEGDGTPIIVINGETVKDIHRIIEIEPRYGNPQWVSGYSQLVNHLSEGYDHELILDAQEFKKKYMEKYNSEDPNEEVGPGVIRLRNFGIPDFSLIAPPEYQGDTLVFFTENVFMGIPYKVTMKKAEAPQYEPVGMVE